MRGACYEGWLKRGTWRIKPLIANICQCDRSLLPVYISRSNFYPIGFNKLMVSQVIDKQTKKLLLAMLPKWLALLILLMVIIGFMI